MRERLAEAYTDARRAYDANGRPAWDAGRVDGLKQALEILDDVEKLPMNRAPHLNDERRN